MSQTDSRYYTNNLQPGNPKVWVPLPLCIPSFAIISFFRHSLPCFLSWPSLGPLSSILPTPVHNTISWPALRKHVQRQPLEVPISLFPGKTQALVVFCKSSPGDFYSAARIEKHSIANMLVIERFMYNIFKKRFYCHFTASTTWQEG